MKEHTCKQLRKQGTPCFPPSAKQALIAIREPPLSRGSTMGISQIEAWSIDHAIYGLPVTLCRPAIAPGSEMSPGGLANYQRARNAFEQMAFKEPKKSAPDKPKSERKSRPDKGQRLDNHFYYTAPKNHRQPGKDPFRAVEWLMEHQGAKGEDIPAEYRRHLIWDARQGNGVVIK